jgi:SAM-dependent methyltransferase
MKKIPERKWINPKIWEWGYLMLKPVSNELKRFSLELKKHNFKCILDLGCGIKPYKSLFPFAEKFVGFDIEKNDSVDFVGINWNLPFRDNEFDALISTQVLEHTIEIKKTASEIKRVVINDGLIFISAPLIYPEHGAPYDYYRFTKYGLQEIFKNFEILKIVPQGGYFNTLFRLLNIFLNYFPGSKYYLFPLFLLNNVVGLFFDKMFFLINYLSKDIYKIYMGMPENFMVIMRNKKS